MRAILRGHQNYCHLYRPSGGHRFITVELENLRQRVQSAVSIGLEIKTASQKTDTDCRKTNEFDRKLQSSVQTITDCHSVHPISTAETKALVAEALLIKNDVDAAYVLPKTRRPEPPPGVVINWYESKVAGLKEFARERNIPVGRRKLLLFKSIVSSLQLPPSTVYITEKDIKRSSIKLSEGRIQSKRRRTDGPDTENFSLSIYSPKVPIPSESVPLSHFIYVNSEEMAKGVIAMFENKELYWELNMPKDFLFSETATGKIEQENQSLEKSTVPTKWSRLHPKFPATTCLAGLNIPSDTNIEGTNDIIGVDTETTGLDPHTCELRLVTISFPKFPTFIFDVFRLWGPDKGPEASKLIIILYKLLHNPRVKKLFFNAKFDYKFLDLKLHMAPRQPIIDLMLQTILLEAGSDFWHNNLNAVVERYLRIPLPVPNSIPWSVCNGWKEAELTTDQLVYASRDAAILPYLANKIAPLLSEAGLDSVAQLENRCIPAVAEMETEGFYLDREKWETLAINTEKDVRIAEKELREVLKWNRADSLHKKVSSPAQVLVALRELNIMIAKPNIGDPSHIQTEDECSLPTKTDAATLSRAIDSPPAVAALLKYRKADKLIKSFIKTLPGHINPVTGRIHSNLKQLGAVSGRFTCSNPNLQQVPRNAAFRSCFCASEGHKLVIADFSQIELRVAADLSDDVTMIEAFASGQDLHKLTASLVKDVSLSEVTKSDRQLAKALNFGLIYGISPTGLKSYASMSYNVALTLDEAREFRSKFFMSYPGLHSWQRRVLNGISVGFGDVYEADTDVPCTRTMSNRRVLFTGKKQSFQKMLNYPVQGTAADMIKQSLVDLHPKLLKVKGKLLHCVHDEIVVQVPEEFANQTAEMVSSTMKDAGNKFLKQVEAEVDAKVGDNWSEKP